MTKKHFEAIATIIKQTGEYESMGVEYSAGFHDALSDVAGSLASEFARENPRFDRHKFLTACGL